MVDNKKSTRPSRRGKSKAKSPQPTAPATVREERNESQVREENEMPETQMAEPIEEAAEPTRATEMKSTPPPAYALGSDEYLMQIFFNKAQKCFTGCWVEFPDLQASARSRDEVVLELTEKLETVLQSFRDRGKNPPEPLSQHQYPSTIELKVSQVLYRKLDTLSRFEKIPLDQLLSEVLSTAIERRYLIGRPQRGQAESRESQHQHQHSHKERHGGHHHDRHHGQHHGQHPHQGEPRGGRDQRNFNRGGGQRRGYNEALESRENFMEYVRNLEKSGGSRGGGNWRKK